VNYLKEGGRHPIGWIGVGTRPAVAKLARHVVSKFTPHLGSAKR